MNCIVVRRTNNPLIATQAILVCIFVFWVSINVLVGNYIFIGLSNFNSFGAI